MKKPHLLLLALVALAALIWFKGDWQALIPGKQSTQ